MTTGPSRLLLFASLLVAGAIGGYLFWYFAKSPGVSIDYLSGDGPPRFAVRSHRIHSIDTFLVWSQAKAEPLWAISFRKQISAEDLREITYGTIPKSSKPSRRVKQVFPIESGPRPITPGERFIILVEYQYDLLFAPCGGDRSFLLEMQKDGSVKAIGNSRYFEMPAAVRAVACKMGGPDP